MSDDVRAALLRYGAHDHSCPAEMPSPRTGLDQGCSCGLVETWNALAAAVPVDAERLIRLGEQHDYEAHRCVGFGAKARAALSAPSEPRRIHGNRHGPDAEGASCPECLDAALAAPSES